MTVAPAAPSPPPDHEQWQRLAADVLRRSGSDLSGSEAESALSTALEDGLRVQPLYTAYDTAPDAGLPGFAPYVRGGRAEGATLGGWDVRQRHTTADPATVLTDLENGVTSLWLVLGDQGIPVSSLGLALDGVHLDLAPVTLDAGHEAGPAAEALLRLYDERGVDRASVRGNLGADPLGHEARTGERVDFAPVAGLARRCADAYPGLRSSTVDALPYHEAGGSAAQELGCSLATGVATLRELTTAGLSVEQAVAQLEFRYAATADQFLTIAKLRAARRLWARVAEVCGAPGRQVQHVVTSPVMMSRRDPWVNMLRTTVATLAGGVGGADAVTVLPFDHALGLPDPFARRIARNTSTVLVEESHLARVIDPAGGSWYVERLTDELAHAGWEFFRWIEGAGGQAAALRSGRLGQALSDTWAVRSAKLAERHEPITGVSEFPNLAEPLVGREPAPEPPSGGLPRVRRDDAFEALRARSDQHLATTGSRPRIFLAAIGPASAHTARLSFASNLFQAGGIEPVSVGSYEDSGATEACLCASDALYEEQAASLAESLKSAGAEHVFLAGRSGPYPGVDASVFTGCDVVAVLSTTLDRMGVS
ncbi:methylmalonyl-CoA mutase family protein [Streptomyces sp. NBC_01012]|uniref:methylmalonyl-CoA mutase family protein n=1 Tax=Streptomyces sp. NBC_01012 TaxID=2903717 RepID=UPI0038686D68|nr:methylmalonyl-CoA mutase subunit beta [Streptomyces sp. NBC_01012]